MTTDDPYKTPASALVTPTSPDESGLDEGSVERALAGNFEVSVGELIRLAWARTRGNKGVLLLSVVLFSVINFAVGAALGLLGAPDGQEAFQAGDFVSGYSQSMLSGLLGVPISAPLTAGLYMLAIKRAGYDPEQSAEAPAGPGELFAYFGMLPRLVGLSLLTTALVYIGLILLVVPGIYLAVSYTFAVPLMVEKDMGIWESLETSRKAVTTRWFSIFGAGLVLYIAGMLLTITLIGSIWGLPMMVLGYGILYRRIFGLGTGAPAAGAPIGTP